MIDRRTLLAATAASPFLARPALAAERGFAIDWQGGEKAPDVVRSLEQQVALVEALPVSDRAMAFFRTQPIAVDRETDTKTRAGPRGVFFERRAVPADNPVLLHELIHRWQLVEMAGYRDPQVVGFYDKAKASGLWPAEAYMLKNPFEFFAMTASVVLHGRAARPPYLRANVKQKAPELYAFIVREFGLRGA